MSRPANFSIPQSADAPVTPSAIFAAIEESLQGLLTSQDGVGRPTYAIEGMVWKDSVTGQLSMFDGTNDLVVAINAGVPASSTATGTLGDMAWDADHIYVCTATDTWKRVALATF